MEAVTKGVLVATVELGVGGGGPRPVPSKGPAIRKREVARTHRVAKGACCSAGGCGLLGVRRDGGPAAVDARLNAVKELRADLEERAVELRG
eukprot:2748891-Alexandrium_andersonii.AAC.1